SCAIQLSASDKEPIAEVSRMYCSSGPPPPGVGPNWVCAKAEGAAAAARAAKTVRRGTIRFSLKPLHAGESRKGRVWDARLPTRAPVASSGSLDHCGARHSTEEDGGGDRCSSPRTAAAPGDIV